MYNFKLHLFSRKLRSRWIGPFIVKEVFSHGAIEIENPSNGAVFKVNGQHLKPFLEWPTKVIKEIMVLYEPTYPNKSSLSVSLAEDFKLS